MRGAVAALLGAALMALGAMGTWSHIVLEPVGQLQGDTVEASGISAGAGGWLLFVLTAVVIVFVLVLVTGISPNAARIVVMATVAAGLWGALRVFQLVGRLNELDDPTFNSQASLSWGPWVYLAGCIVTLVGALWVIRTSAKAGPRAGGSSTIQSP
jgi:hypothetical protein